MNHQMKSMCYFLAIALVLGLHPASAQDAVFSLCDRSALSLNPTLTGFLKDGRARLLVNHSLHMGNLYTKQSFEISQISFDGSICAGEDFFGVGLQVQSSNSGFSDFTSSHVLASTSYHHRLSGSTYLAAGAAAGLLQNRINRKRLRFDEQFDGTDFNPTLSANENFEQGSALDFDLWVGMLAYDTKRHWTLGLAIYHLNEPEISLLSSGGHLLGVGAVVHGSIGLFDEDLVLRGMYRRQSVSSDNSRQWQQVVGGNYLVADLESSAFWVGSSMRFAGRSDDKAFLLDAWIPTISWEQEKFALHLGYDVRLSRLSYINQYSGHFEINFEYRFGVDNECINCPQF